MGGAGSRAFFAGIHTANRIEQQGRLGRGKSAARDGLCSYHDSSATKKLRALFLFSELIALHKVGLERLGIIGGRDVG